MSLNRGQIVKGARLTAGMLTDLYDLLLGTMTDQDVTFGKNVTIRGSLTTVGATNQQAANANTVAATFKGAVGQGTSLLELQDSSSNILFRVDQGGTLWSNAAGSGPKITEFTNAQHTHLTNAQGGSLGAAAVTSIMLGPDVQRSNLLLNGSMDTWTGGTGPFTTNGATTADNWLISLAGADAISVSRNSTDADVAGQYCAAVTYTAGSPTSPSTALYQNVDQYQLRGKTVTFSVRVKTSVASAARAFATAGDGGSRTYGLYHPGNNQYTTLSVTVAVSATTTTTPQFGVELTTNSGSFFVDNGMLVIGQSVADFVPQVSSTLFVGSTLSDPKITGQVIKGTGTFNLPGVSGNTGAWRFYKMTSASGTITPATGEALWAPGATAASANNVAYVSPAGESTGWYCDGVNWMSL